MQVSSSYRNQAVDLHWKSIGLFQYDRKIVLNPFQPSVAFHIETSHLLCTKNQMAGFYMKCNSGMNWFKWVMKIAPCPNFKRDFSTRLHS